MDEGNLHLFCWHFLKCSSMSINSGCRRASSARRSASLPRLFVGAFGRNRENLPERSTSAPGNELTWWGIRECRRRSTLPHSHLGPISHRRAGYIKVGKNACKVTGGNTIPLSYFGHGCRPSLFVKRLPSNGVFR